MSDDWNFRLYSRKCVNIFVILLIIWTFCLIIIFFVSVDKMSKISLEEVNIAWGEEKVTIREETSSIEDTSAVYKGRRYQDGKSYN